MNNNLVLKANNSHKYQFVYNEILISGERVVSLPKKSEWHGTIKEILRDLNIKSLMSRHI